MTDASGRPVDLEALREDTDPTRAEQTQTAAYVGEPGETTDSYEIAFTPPDDALPDHTEAGADGPVDADADVDANGPQSGSVPAGGPTEPARSPSA